jgi:hypothetical protein
MLLFLSKVLMLPRMMRDLLALVIATFSLSPSERNPIEEPKQ